jgi:hypothetical protein
MSPHNMLLEAERGRRYIAPLILSLGAICPCMLNATSQPLYYWEKRLITHFTGNWVGSMAGLNARGEKKMSCSDRRLELRNIQAVARRYTVCSISALYEYMKFIYP